MKYKLIIFFLLGFVNVQAQKSGTDITDYVQAQIIAAGETAPIKIKIPDGTSYISHELTAYNRINLDFEGTGSKSCKLIWTGLPGGNMFNFNAISYSTFAHMTLDGGGMNIALINQSTSNDPNTQFDTGDRYEDVVFQNATYGVEGGWRGFGFAEPVFDHCKFLNLEGGISSGNFNALDIWVWYCLFKNCKKGVMNSFNSMQNTTGSGGFKIYGSTFEDCGNVMDIQATEGFALRGNVIKNCADVIHAGYNGNNSMQVASQGNLILDHTGYFINTLNIGPIFSVDDTIKGSIVSQGWWGVQSLGTRSSTDDWGGYLNRRFLYDTKQVNLDSVTAPAYKEYIPNTNPTYEVKAGSSIEFIQQIIDEAARMKGANVHVPAGVYNTSTKLRIHDHVRLIGDGTGVGFAPFGTVFNWTGAKGGKVIEIDGSGGLEKVGISGNDAAKDGVSIINIDKVGGYVFTDQLEIRNCNSRYVFVDGLDHAKVTLTNSGVTYGGKNAIGFLIKGGPLMDQGKGESITTAYAGQGSIEGVMVDVWRGGKIVYKDWWKEAQPNSRFIYTTDSSKGDMSFDGGRLHYPKYLDPATLSPMPYADVTLNSFPGNVSFTSYKIDSHFEIKGDASKTNLLVASSLLDEQPYLKNTNGNATYLWNLRLDFGDNADPNPLTDVDYGNGVSLGMLSDSRSVKVPSPDGADIPLKQVWIQNCDNGFHIEGTTAPVIKLIIETHKTSSTTFSIKTAGFTFVSGPVTPHLTASGISKMTLPGKYIFTTATKQIEITKKLK